MNTSSCPIQSTFHVPEEQAQPLTGKNNDFSCCHELPCNRFLPIENQKRPSKVEDPAQQRHKTYNHIIQKLTEGNLPGKNHAVNYLRDKYRRNLSIRTLLASGYTIRQFLLFLQGNDRPRIEELTRQDVEAYVEHEQDRGLKIRAVKTKLTALYAFINYLVKSNILPPEILQRKIKIKIPTTLPRAIPSDDIEKFLPSVSDVRDRAMIMLLLRTGMRIGELLNLHVADINLQEQKILIYIGEKNAQGRVVYFCDDAKEALMLWLRTRNPEQRYLFYGLRGRPLSYSGARKAFRKYLEKSDLVSKGYTPHQLRHTFASELLNAGMRLEVLQQLLGHTTIEMTRHYARLTDKTREEEYFLAMKYIEREGIHGLY